MINYGKQYIDKYDIKNVVQTLKSNFLTQGPKVKEFENNLKKKFKSKRVLVVSSGTAALHLINRSIGLKSGDKVISSPITFLSGIATSMHCGAIPDFVDINKKTFNLDPQRLEDKLKKEKRAKAVIVTDFAGQPSDWDDLFYLRKKYKIKLINDNCHSIGSKYKNLTGYASKYSDATAMSFHPVKNITSGEGGAILTNNEEIFEKSKVLRSHGIIKEDEHEKWYYEMVDLGYNFRLSDIHASLGISQLRKLEKFVKFRQGIAKKYNKLFFNLNHVSIPYLEKNRTHSYHLYVLQIDFKKINKNKSELFKIFQRNGISLQVHYIPLFLHPYFIKNYKFKKNDFPNSMDYYEKSFSIPIFFGIKESIIRKTFSLIKKFVN